LIGDRFSDVDLSVHNGDRQRPKGQAEVITVPGFARR
jgi:hypothetical protein